MHSRRNARRLPKCSFFALASLRHVADRSAKTLLAAAISPGDLGFEAGVCAAEIDAPNTAITAVSVRTSATRMSLAPND
jgi:hypothetical protein